MDWVEVELANPNASRINDTFETRPGRQFRCAIRFKPERVAIEVTARGLSLQRGTLVAGKPVQCATHLPASWYKRRVDPSQLPQKARASVCCASSDSPGRKTIACCADHYRYAAPYQVREGQSVPRSESVCIFQ